MPPALLRPARLRVPRLALVGLLAAGVAAPLTAGAAHAGTPAATTRATCVTTDDARTCVSAPVTMRDTTRYDARGREVRTTVVRVRTTLTVAGVRTTTTRWTTRTSVDGRQVRARTRTTITRHTVRPRPAAAGRTATAAHATAVPTAATSAAAGIERAVLALTNEERRKAGLAPCAADGRLDAVSRRWSATMARTGDFRHGGDWSWMPGDRARTGGENLFVVAAPVDEAYARAAVQGWMSSPAHRANILEPAFTRLGVGLARAGDGRVYTTQTFAG